MVGAPCCLAVIGASGAERRRVGALIVFEGVAGGSQFLPTIGSPDLLPGLQRIAIAILVLAFLWWRPIQRWDLGIDELERRIEALEQRR